MTPTTSAQSLAGAEPADGTEQGGPKCERCNGTGAISGPDYFGNYDDSDKCPACKGSGIGCCVSGVCDYHNALNDTLTGLPAELIAGAFHEAYERLGPAYGYKTRDESAVPWDDVPETNKRLMVHVVGELLAEGIIQQSSACPLRGCTCWSDRHGD